MAEVASDGEMGLALAREGDLVLGVRELVLELQEVRVRLQLRVGLGDREEGLEGPGEEVVGGHGLLGALGLQHRRARLAHVLQELALVLRVALHGLDEVRDQVVPPLELHVDIRPRLVGALPQTHEPVVDHDGEPDEQRRKELEAEIEARVAEVDKSMAVSKLPESVVVYRGVKDGSRMFSQDVWFGKYLGGPDDDFDEQDRLWALWEAGERPDLTGVTWEEKAFAHTTVNGDRLAGGGHADWHHDRDDQCIRGGELRRERPRFERSRGQLHADIHGGSADEPRLQLDRAFGGRRRRRVT